eukprot:CAMPEP_0172613986 /NCGR_PEP_ID=MMETSP1068-20121228/49116_1 /TAXON_ID=35684 /ORGANISM="Pseudopedinella elastica, Strain CCMP716" /LENGTH=55 /DNA_ID=CAMNT_0013418635 /DNA_START=524 /DNA_END=691 /DNA_ORIENTATION=-
MRRFWCDVMHELRQGSRGARIRRKSLMRSKIEVDEGRSEEKDHAVSYFKRLTSGM